MLHFISAPLSLQDIMGFLEEIGELKAGWQDLLLRMARFRIESLTVKSLEALRLLVDFKAILYDQLQHSPVTCPPDYDNLTSLLSSL